MFSSRTLTAAVLSLLIANSTAAMLGEIRVNSALGEKFDASIPVASTYDEDINSSCFRLVSPHDGGDQNVLRRAKLIFQQDGDGGRLLVHGFEALPEPVVNVSVRVKCPGEEDRVFQRDYSVLLDPREYKTTQSRKPAGFVSSNKKSRRSLPRLGSVWLTEEGDTIASIARRYYPNDERLRAQFIDGVYDLNPDLPQGTSVRLGGDWRLQLPSPTINPVVVNPPARVAPMSQQEAQPRLTLDPAPVIGAMPLSEPVAPAGEFRLRLSLPSMDLSQKNNLSPEETLRLRERLLSLESDEQAAQMLQLKYQITQLERQLSSLKASGIESSPLRLEAEGPLASRFSWSWLVLIALIVAVLAFVLWRKRVHQRQAQEEPFSMLGISTMHVNPYGSVPIQRPTTSFNSQFLTRTGGFTDDEVGIPVRNMDDDEWHDEDMDVISPNSVAEEAQLLIDHGLTKQAINLLMHEVAERPTALALWMKLFDVFQQNNMVELFQERAVAFRLQFSSEALWQEVQDLGLQIDPSNPLYQSMESTLDLSAFFKSEDSGVELASSNLPAGLYNDAELNAPPVGSPSAGQSNEFGFEIDFSPLQSATSAEEKADEETIFVTTVDAFELSDKESYSAESSVVSIGQSDIVKNTTQAAIDTADFVSDDEILQEIAKLIAIGQQREAFDSLEVLLYKGTMPQRLTASKWLDKLLSKYGKL